MIIVKKNLTSLHFKRTFFNSLKTTKFTLENVGWITSPQSYSMGLLLLAKVWDLSRKPEYTAS